MTAGSSPATSEIASVTTGAGAAAAASLPPLIAERCLRTQFISPMAAPERSNACVTARLSSSVMPCGRKRQQRRRTARDEAQHEIVGPEPFDAREDAPGGVGARCVRHRMARLDHLDAAAGDAVAIARDDDPLERLRPMVFDRARHRRRGLAGADDDGAALGRRRQVGRHAARRVRRRERGIEQALQHGLFAVARAIHLAAR